jgi:hypothetical protein
MVIAGIIPLNGSHIIYHTTSQALFLIYAILGKQQTVGNIIILCTGLILIGIHRFQQLQQF